MDAPARTLLALAILAQPAGVSVSASGLIAQAPSGTQARAQVWGGYELSGAGYAFDCQSPSTVELPARITLTGNGQLRMRDGGTLTWEVQWARGVSFDVVRWQGPSDFDCDEDAGTDADITAFFECLAAGCASADYDGDGSPATDADIACFFAVLRGGTC